MSRTLASAAALWILALAPLAAWAEAEQGSLANRCPAYTEHLQRARTLLQASDREPALEALRQAKESLAACIRREAAGTRTMLAAVPAAGAQRLSSPGTLG